MMRALQKPDFPAACQAEARGRSQTRKGERVGWAENVT